MSQKSTYISDQEIQKIQAVLANQTTFRTDVFQARHLDQVPEFPDSDSPFVLEVYYQSDSSDLDTNPEYLTILSGFSRFSYIPETDPETNPDSVTLSVTVFDQSFQDLFNLINKITAQIEPEFTPYY